MKPHLLLIDNYDSFTYNLVQAFLVLGAEVSVYRNDALTPQAAQALAPSHLCISPGPGTPYDAGVSMDMIRAFAGRIPVLGVCLGHQSIVEVFGGKVVRAERLMHGKTSLVQPRRAHAVRRTAAAVRSRALPLPDRSACEPAGAARGERAHRGRGDHGGAPSHAQRRGRAVSSGEHPHAAGPDAAEQLPAVRRGGARRGMSAAPGHDDRARAAAAAARAAQSLAGAGRGSARAALRCADAARHGGRAAGGARGQGSGRRRRSAAWRRPCGVWRAGRPCPPGCARSISSAPVAMLPGASTSRPARRCSPPPAAYR